jgi:hypothetical protein
MNMMTAFSNDAQTADKTKPLDHLITEAQQGAFYSVTLTDASKWGIEGIIKELDACARKHKVNLEAAKDDLRRLETLLSIIRDQQESVLSMLEDAEMEARRIRYSEPQLGA